MVEGSSDSQGSHARRVCSVRFRSCYEFLGLGEVRQGDQFCVEPLRPVWEPFPLHVRERGPDLLGHLDTVAVHTFLPGCEVRDEVEGRSGLVGMLAGREPEGPPCWEVGPSTVPGAVDVGASHVHYLTTELYESFVISSRNI